MTFQGPVAPSIIREALGVANPESRKYIAIHSSRIRFRFRCRGFGRISPAGGPRSSRTLPRPFRRADWRPATGSVDGGVSRKERLALAAVLDMHRRAREAPQGGNRRAVRRGRRGPRGRFGEVPPRRDLAAQVPARAWRRGSQRRLDLPAGPYFPYGRDCRAPVSKEGRAAFRGGLV